VTRMDWRTFRILCMSLFLFPSVSISSFSPITASSFSSPPFQASH
jgi:hypothetical protein